MALLGTHLSDAKVEEINAAEPRYDTVLIALDADATAQAIRMQLENRSKIRGLYVTALTKDIKDMTDDEFQSWLTASL